MVISEPSEHELRLHMSNIILYSCLFGVRFNLDKLSFKGTGDGTISPAPLVYTNEIVSKSLGNRWIFTVYTLLQMDDAFRVQNYATFTLQEDVPACEMSNHEAGYIWKQYKICGFSLA